MKQVMCTAKINDDIALKCAESFLLMSFEHD